MKRLILFVVIAFLIASCSHRNSNTDEQDAIKVQDSIVVIKQPFKDQPDKIEFETPVLTGTQTKHGIQKRYYSHGSIYSEIPYIRGSREGISYTYYKAFNGQKSAVWKKQTYKNNDLDGPCWRYYQNGKIQAEYEYKDGMPAMGLKEYKESGSEIKQPKLFVNVSPAGSFYYLTAQLENVKSRVTFYFGELKEGRFLPKDLKTLQDKEGLGELLLPLDQKGKTVRITAVYTTRLGNLYLTTTTKTIE